MTATSAIATPQATQTERRAAISVQSQVMPRAERTGRANAKVMMRSGGKRPVAMPRGTPSSVTVAQATRNRRVKPWALGTPAAAVGSRIQGAYRSAFCQKRSM